MGNLIGKKSKAETDIDDLKDRLSNLEKLDKNQDGVVSKEEFNLWMKQQEKDIELFKKTIEEKADAKYQKIIMDNERELNESKQEVKDLKKEIKSLQKINETLERRMKKDDPVSTNSSSDVETDSFVKVDPNQHTRLSELSKQRINQFVETLLDDENININYFPDAIERQIYRNVFTILVNLLDTLFESTNVKFLGHKLVFDFVPLEEGESSEVPD